MNNYFQKNIDGAVDEITQKAQQEFDDFVSKLRKVGVNVIVVDDIAENNKAGVVKVSSFIDYKITILISLNYETAFIIPFT